MGAKPHLFSLISKLWKSLFCQKRMNWISRPFKCIFISFKLPVVSSTFKIFVRRKMPSSFLEVLAGQLYFGILTTVGRQDLRQLTQHIGLLSLFFLDNSYFFRHPPSSWWLFTTRIWCFFCRLPASRVCNEFHWANSYLMDRKDHIALLLSERQRVREKM